MICSENVINEGYRIRGDSSGTGIQWKKFIAIKDIGKLS